MSLSFDHLNEGGTAEEEFILEECSGNAGDHSDRVMEVLGDNHECMGGHWITLVDGEIYAAGEFHPFRIHWEAE